MSRLDLVIFGATGFTGKHAVEEAARIAQRDRSLTWGVAGRSRTKLEAILQEVKNKTGEDISSVRVIVADVGDEESLKAMTAQAKVVANCCGPYRHYGEPVVRACIATKTHHVDVSGEPQFIETIQLKYHKQAEEAGVYIVSACGLDSIPNDMGVIFLEDNFKVWAEDSTLQSGFWGKVDVSVSFRATRRLRGYLVVNLRVPRLEDFGHQLVIGPVYGTI